MRKLIIAVFCIVCIWAYPEKYDFDIHFDKIEITKHPDSSQRFKHSALLADQCDILAAFKDVEALNKCIDILINTIDDSIGQDGIPLDDMHSGFNYTLIIHYHGELDLTNGEMTGLSSLARTADADFHTNVLTTNFSVPLVFEKLAITYDYSAKIMNLGPTGGIEASVTNLEFQVAFNFDLLQRKLTLVDLEITSSGHIDFKFTGHALVDWLLNLLSDVVTALLKKVILNVMENVVKTAIEAIVDAINQSLPTESITLYEKQQSFMNQNLKLERYY